MTRREFLALLGATGGGYLSDALADLKHPDTAPTATTTRATSGEHRLTGPAWGKAQVVEVQSPRLVAGMYVHEKLLREMIDLAICHVTGTENPADAWHTLLDDGDVIGLKFNSSGAAGIGTTEPFARVLVASLTRSGWAPEKIVLIETPRVLALQLGTQLRRDGWQSAVTHFGSGVDELAAVLDQVTAIVNVPFLKANKIAGMSGCLKNLSHAMIKHPSRFHDNPQANPQHGILKPGRRCAPYIGDIVANTPIRNKLRLHLVNALRTLREPMFDPTGPAVESYGAILAGTDPVAVDMVGLELLNHLRRAHGSEPLTAPDEPLPLHRAASQAGLGVWQPDAIDHLVLRA